MPTHLSTRPSWALLPAVVLLLGSLAAASPAGARDDEDGDATTGAVVSETYGLADAEGSEVTIEAEVYVETEDPALGAGTVTFSEGSTVLGAVAVVAETDLTDGEVASLVVRSVAPGSHRYTVAFTPGSAAVEPSSDTASVKVARAARVSLALEAPASVRRGGRVTVLATLTSAAGPAPTGTVVATAGRRSYRATLRSGRATFKIPVTRRTKVVVTYAGPPIIRRSVRIAAAKPGQRS